MSTVNETDPPLLSTIVIRSERPEDLDAIHDLNKSIFGTSSEANLVDMLRERASPVISLVAMQAGDVVGHILFSPVSLVGHPELFLMGLGPMAVSSRHQRTGIGSQLVHAGIETSREYECAAIAVLGHKDYYPRFGFLPASHFGIDCEYDVPEGVFMVLELIPHVLSEVSGAVRYHDAFGSV